MKSSFKESTFSVLRINISMNEIFWNELFPNAQYGLPYDIPITYVGQELRLQVTLHLHH